jgi:hypothetical protein
VPSSLPSAAATGRVASCSYPLRQGLQSGAPRLFHAVTGSNRAGIQCKRRPFGFLILDVGSARTSVSAPGAASAPAGARCCGRRVLGVRHAEQRPAPAPRPGPVAQPSVIWCSLLRPAHCAGWQRAHRAWDAPVTHTSLSLNASGGRRRVRSRPKSASALRRYPCLAWGSCHVLVEGNNESKCRQASRGYAWSAVQKHLMNCANRHSPNVVTPAISNGVVHCPDSSCAAAACPRSVTAESALPNAEPWAAIAACAGRRPALLPRTALPATGTDLNCLQRLVKRCAGKQGSRVCGKRWSLYLASVAYTNA